MTSKADLNIMIGKLMDFSRTSCCTEIKKKKGEKTIVLLNGDILCWKGLQGRKEYRVGFLSNKKIPGRTEALYSNSERVKEILFDQNKRYNLKTDQTCSIKTIGMKYLINL